MARPRHGTGCPGAVSVCGVGRCVGPHTLGAGGQSRPGRGGGWTRSGLCRWPRGLPGGWDRSGHSADPAGPKPPGNGICVVDNEGGGRVNSKKLMCLERASERPGMLGHCWSSLGLAFVPRPLGAGVQGSGGLITVSRTGQVLIRLGVGVTPRLPFPTPGQASLRTGRAPTLAPQVHVRCG